MNCWYVIVPPAFRIVMYMLPEVWKGLNKWSQYFVPPNLTWVESGMGTSYVSIPLLLGIVPLGAEHPSHHPACSLVALKSWNHHHWKLYFFHRANDVVLNSTMLTSQNYPPPCSALPLRQPIFEDDSPSRFSTISALENPEQPPQSLRCEFIRLYGLFCVEI